MSTTTEQLRATVADLMMSAIALNASENNDTLSEWLNVAALDVQVSARWSLMVDEPRAMTDREVHVLLTLGGPNVWLIADDNEGVRVEGYWETDDWAERRVLPWLANSLQEYADAFMGE